MKAEAEVVVGVEGLEVGLGSLVHGLDEGGVSDIVYGFDVFFGNGEDVVFGFALVDVFDEEAEVVLGEYLVLSVLIDVAEVAVGHACGYYLKCITRVT